MKRPPPAIRDCLRREKPAIRRRLLAVRRLVLERVPDAEERLSYGMPAVFHAGRVVVYYAAFKAHIGLFPPVTDATLQVRLAAHAGPKGNLRFPHDRPLPLGLIAAVVRSRLRTLRARRTPAPRRR